MFAYCLYWYYQHPGSWLTSKEFLLFSGCILKVARPRVAEELPAHAVVEVARLPDADGDEIADEGRAVCEGRGSEPILAMEAAGRRGETDTVSLEKMERSCESV